MRLVIENDAAQQILDYIQTKPFREVYKLVAILTTLKPLEHVEAEETKEVQPSKSSQAKTS